MFDLSILFYIFLYQHYRYAVWIYAREREPLMQSSSYDRYRRNMGVKETSAFVDLEKAFERVLREVTRRALRKAGV